MKKYAVYVHKKKDNGDVFYVGCCTRQDKRRAATIKKYQRAFDFGQRRPDWFKIVKESGGVVVEIVFSSDNKEEAFNKEKELVDYYGRHRFNNGLLVNECLGGNGAPGQYNSKATRLKKSIAQKGSRNSMHGKRGRETGTARRVMNVKTSKMYESVSEAAEFYGYRMKTLYNWLSGHRKNQTDLRFI